MVLITSSPAQPVASPPPRAHSWQPRRCYPASPTLRVHVEVGPLLQQLLHHRLMSVLCRARQRRLSNEVLGIGFNVVSLNSSFTIASCPCSAANDSAN